MSPDDGSDTLCGLVVAVKERVRRFQEGIQGGKQLAMGDFTPKLPPQHLDGVEPGAIGGPIPPHQPSSGGAHDGFNRRISMGVGSIPRHRDGARGRLVDQGLPPFGDLLAPFAAAQHHGFAGLIGDGAQPLALVRLPWGGNHDVLTARTPHGAQGGGSQLSVHSSASSNTAPGFKWSRVSSIIFFLAHSPGPDC